MSFCHTKTNKKIKLFQCVLYGFYSQIHVVCTVIFYLPTVNTNFRKKPGIPTLNIHGKGWLLTAVNIVVIKEHFKGMFSSRMFRTFKLKGNGQWQIKDLSYNSISKVTSQCQARLTRIIIYYSFLKSNPKTQVFNY